MYIEKEMESAVLEDEEREVQVLTEVSEFNVHKYLQAVKDVIDYNWISYYNVNPVTGLLEQTELDEMGFNMIDAIQFRSGPGLTAWVANQQRPVLLGSVHKSQRFHSNPIKSFMCCPVIRNGETVGVINLGHTRVNAYNNRTLRRLNSILNSE